MSNKRILRPTQTAEANILKNNNLFQKGNCAISYVIVLLIASLIGCTAAKLSKSDKDISPTGTTMTPEWNAYNVQAENSGAPLLKYLVTATDIESERPQNIQDEFSLDDKQIYVYTKWIHVTGKPTYKIKIYSPMGVLFFEKSYAYRGGTGVWTIWDRLFVKDWAASKLPGIWRAEIFMDDKFVTEKKFIIGSQDTKYEQKTMNKNAITIGVLPFVDHDHSNRTNGYNMSLYIAQMLTVDLESNIIMPAQLLNDTIMPLIKYDDYKKYLVKEVNSEDSELNTLSNKYKLDILITGRSYDSNTVGNDITTEIYIVNFRTKQIDEIKDRYIYDMHDPDLSGHRVSSKLYKRFYDNVLKKGFSKF
jgi:hypothetical protein